MTMRQPPFRSPRLEGEILPELRLAIPDVTIVNQRPADPTMPYRHAIVVAHLQQRVGMLRYARIRVQGWSVRADGTANFQDAFDLARDVCDVLESLGGSIVNAETDSGPDRVIDDLSGIEHAYAIVLARVKQAHPQ